MAHIEDFDPQQHITQERATEIVDAYERRKNLNPHGHRDPNEGAQYSEIGRPGEINLSVPNTWISAQVSNHRLRNLLNDLHYSLESLIDKEDTRPISSLGLKKNIQLIQQSFIRAVNKGWHEGLWSQQERDKAIDWGGEEAREFIESVKNIRYPQDQPDYY